MKKMTILSLIAVMLLTANVSFAEFGIGADVVSRYVWRGTDFGNSASVQPALTYTAGNLEIGAWGSYGLTAAAAGANENDLYISYAIGDLGITVTDYYFPEAGEAFNYKDEDSIHFLEASLSYSIGKVSLLAAMFFMGDPDDSPYVEAGYELVSDDDMSATLTVGAGDGMYTVEDGFGVVNVGLTVSKGSMFASYIINPEAETNFLVFGMSF